MIGQNTLYISRLDHLRFYAAAWVFLYHTFVSLHPDPLWSHASIRAAFHPVGAIFTFILHGHSGVGLFIVLSGFTFALITINRAIDWKTFLLNRFLRIYPLYLFWTFLLFYGIKENRSQDFLMALVPFLDLKRNGMAQHFSTLWSVVVECQIYIIFPLLKKIYDRKGNGYFFGLIALLLILRFLIYSSYGSTTQLAYWTLFGRLDQFLIGYLAGVLYTYQKTIFRPILWWLLLPVSIGLLVIALNSANQWGLGDVFFEGQNAIIWVFWPLIEGILFALLIFGYLVFPFQGPKVADRLLSKLGELSFSLYVVQFLVILGLRTVNIYVSDNLNEMIFVNWLMVLLPAGLALSFMTHSLIEKPFLQMRRRYVQ